MTEPTLNHCGCGGRTAILYRQDRHGYHRARVVCIQCEMQVTSASCLLKEQSRAMAVAAWNRALSRPGLSTEAIVADLRRLADEWDQWLITHPDVDMKYKYLVSGRVDTLRNAADTFERDELMAEPKGECDE